MPYLESVLSNLVWSLLHVHIANILLPPRHRVLFWDYSNLFLDTNNYLEIKIDTIFGIAVIDLGLG